MSAGPAQPALAALSVTAAMALIGLIDNLVVFIAGLAGLWQFHLIRAAMAVPLIVALGHAAGWRVRPLRWRAVGVRSLLVSGSMLLYFGALGFLTVAEVAAGLFTAPIWVLLISVFWFGERVGAVRIACILTGFSGILLVLRPWGAELSAVSLMPLGAGFFYALGGIATRRLCAEEGTLAILLGFFLTMALWGALGCAVLAAWQPAAPAGSEGFLLRGWQAPGAVFLGLTLVQAVGAVAGVGLLVRGYLLAEASFVAAFEYVFLIFAALWGWLLWRDVPDAIALAGIALIIASGVLLAMRSRAPAAEAAAAP